MRLADLDHLGPMLRLLGLTLLLATAASAQTRQFGAVQYPVPDGWAPADYDGYAGARSTSGPSAQLLVFQGAASAGDLSRWLAERTRLWRGDADLVTSDEMPIDRDDGLPAIARMEITRQYGDFKYSLHVAILARGRMEHVALVVRSQDGLPESVATFEQWMNALRFAAPAALASGAEPGSLDGVYVGMGTTYGLNGPGIGLRYYVFTREGWFQDDLPEATGLSRYDPRDAVATAPDEAGTYRLEGATLTLRYADGDREEVEFDPGDDGSGPDMDLDGFGFYRVAPPEDGARFEGTFRYGQYLSTESTTQSTARSYENTIRLWRDGRFTTTETSFFSAQGGTYTVASGDGPAEVRGTYEVAGGALILTARRGAPSTLSLLRYDENLLLIDGDAYHRVPD